MQVAFLMGANKITLAGCENRVFGQSDSHADIGIPYVWNASWHDKPYVGMSTKWLAEILVENNVDTQRYYNAETEFYKKGYETI